MDIVSFPKGKVLFKQGESSDAAYIVASGAVGLYREAQGRKIPLATVRKGELFGEMAVIDGSPRIATAFALEDSKLTVISIDTMVDKMKRADPFIRTMIHMLMNNLRAVHDSHTPKSRSLIDAVNSLARQCDIVGRLLQGDLPPDFRGELEKKLKTLDPVIKELRRLAMTHRHNDRRDDAVPNEAELPQ
ncbi:MAG: cyclic nucleotide-binding domain-containing protein [Rhodospirillaceae bacterium]|nr:cyclic nucleotide-binding domain-containing protein [Rhodospirillaceae bacterium]